MVENGTAQSTMWSRRRVLALGLGGLVAAASAGVELVARGTLPGRQLLNRFDGACSVSSTPPSFAASGPSISNRFFSAARNQMVGYTIAFPPGHGPGSVLPLIVMLHAYGGNHTDPLSSMSMPQALALRIDGQPLTPMAMVAADGGGGYWNPHPGDNPMGMVIDELIPMCQKMGLGLPPHKIATMGVSMGGYGAVLLAEKYPQLITAVAAISPAIWTTFDQAHHANAGAYASADDFAANNAVTHASALARTPVRVASGDGDAFHPGVKALAAALPISSVVDFSKGCHDGSFFASQEPASMSFLARQLIISADSNS